MTEFLIEQQIFDQEDIEETEKLGSFNHSYVQAKLATLLVTQTPYTVCSELSLDMSQLDWTKLQVKSQSEATPDLCLYPKRGLSEPYDILRMTEMPLLIIEILSPRQGTQDILEKFGVYFAAGVQSCWLVDPLTKMIAVYYTIRERYIFSSDDIVDEALNIRLPFNEIFT